MTEHLPVLRRVGRVLLIVGLLDIGLMIYCIVRGVSYSSSFNIFAVIAGILLMRGHLGTARIVTWFSAFMFTGLTLAVVAIFPWVWPLDYWLLAARRGPVNVLIGLIVSVAALVMLYWVYTQLRSPAVVAARGAAGYAQGPPTSAVIAGSALALFMAVMMHLTLNGETAQEAKRRAAQEHGEQYRYFVSSLNWSGAHVSARLVAYNDDETKDVEVDWRR